MKDPSVPGMFVVVVVYIPLRGGIVIRTRPIDKNLHMPVLLRSIFGLDWSVCDFILFFLSLPQKFSRGNFLR